MSRYTHTNVSRSPLLNRRAFLGIAGVAVACCGFVGVRGCIGSQSADSVDIKVSDAVSSGVADGFVKQIETVCGTASASSFSDSQMDVEKWKSVSTGDRPWIVFGAGAEGASALSKLDCHDWADQARDFQDLLSFAFNDASLCAFPLEGDVGMLLCNKTLLDSIGVGCPSDVDELVEISSILREAGIEPIALEKVDVNSVSLDLALDASIAFWTCTDYLVPESQDEAISTIAASVLRCGKTSEGASPFETREEALRAFEEGKAAMVLISSGDIPLLLNSGQSCYAFAIPTLSSDGVPALRATRSIVCSTKLSESAYTPVMEWLQRVAVDGVSGRSGTVGPFRNDEGGLTFKDLPESVSLSLMPPVLLDGDALDESMRQSWRERIVALWNQQDIEPISYTNEKEVDA